MPMFDLAERYRHGVRYLSPEWLIAADQALRTAEPAPTGRLVIDQHVDDAGSWRIVIDTNAAVIALGGDLDSIEEADAVFSQSLATAQAVAQGTTSAHQAFLLGEICFDGQIDTLIARRESLTWLERALAPVMAATQWAG